MSMSTVCLVPMVVYELETMWMNYGNCINKFLKSADTTLNKRTMANYVNALIEALNNEDTSLFEVTPTIRSSVFKLLKDRELLDNEAWKNITKDKEHFNPWNKNQKVATGYTKLRNDIIFLAEQETAIPFSLLTHAIDH
jgi:hypothetical protein